MQNRFHERGHGTAAEQFSNGVMLRLVLKGKNALLIVLPS
jgi:hypothetical protein